MNRVFADISFRGKFRSYQQEVLDEAGRYLADKKIHIVAAPGSGKTVLGLELIRRVGAPTLILSPSVTVRQQWGERFAELFLPDILGIRLSSAASEISISSAASASLKHPSVTISQSRIVAQEKFRPTNGVVLPAASGLIVMTG